MPQIKRPAKNHIRSKHSPIIGVLLLVCLFFCQFSTVFAAPPVLKVGVSGRAFFQHIDEQGNFAGLDVELSKLIFAEAGFRIQFISYPWSRIVHLVKLGKLDVALSAGQSEERRQFALFSNQTLRLGQNYLFTLKDKANRFQEFTELNQLQSTQQRIAVYRGARYSTEYFQLLNEPWFTENLIIVDSQPRTVESLIRGRSDALIGSEYGVLATAKKLGVSDDIVAVFPLMSKEEAETHIMYSKKSVAPEWVDQIDAAMNRLKESGKYQQTIADYISSH